MEPFTKALEVVARVMREGAATHPDNDWVERSPEYHLGRAAEHLRLWRDGDPVAGPCVLCSDAVVDGLNLTRAGGIRQASYYITGGYAPLFQCRNRDSRPAAPRGLVLPAVRVKAVIRVREYPE